MTDTNEGSIARNVEAEPPASRSGARVIKLLSEQRRLLMLAGCEKDVLVDYASLIRFLKSATPDELHRIFPEPPEARRRHDMSLDLDDADIVTLPSSEVRRLTGEPTTPRKLLERIAIFRFRVPRGSMRSFSNREMLMDKLITLLENEQAHETIENVAKGQGEPRGLRAEE